MGIGFFLALALPALAVLDRFWRVQGLLASGWRRTVLWFFAGIGAVQVDKLTIYI